MPWLVLSIGNFYQWELPILGRVYNFLNRYVIIFDRKAINCVTSFSKIQINFGQIFVSFTKSIRFKVIITKCSLIYLRLHLSSPQKVCTLVVRTSPLVWPYHGRVACLTLRVQAFYPSSSIYKDQRWNTQGPPTIVNPLCFIIIFYLCNHYTGINMFISTG